MPNSLIVNKNDKLIIYLENSIAHNIGTSGNVEIRGLVSRAGQQAIYDKNGNLVTDPVNMGTFDFSSPTTAWGFAQHYFTDIQPWIDWGNSPEDITTRAQRNAIPIDSLKSGTKEAIKSLFQ